MSDGFSILTSDASIVARQLGKAFMKVFGMVARTALKAVLDAVDSFEGRVDG